MKMFNLQNIKYTIYWIVLIPIILFIDFIFYILGIFFKEFRYMFIKQYSLEILEAMLPAQLKGNEVLNDRK